MSEATAGTNTTTTTDRTESTWPTLVALAALTVLCTVVAGPFGLLAGLVTAATWYVLETPYAIAAGHVVLAAAVSGGIDIVGFALVELGFLAVLVAPLVGTPAPRGTAAITVGSAVGLVATGWLVAQSQPLWIAASTVTVLATLAIYGLHRYELVRLGLVPDEPTATTPTDP